MIHAYRVLGPNKVHEHVALLQCSLWHPPRPTPGILNSRERPRGAVIGGRAARGVVDTPTPGKGCCGRATRVYGQDDHVCWFCAHWYHGRRPCAPELRLCALKTATVQRQTVTIGQSPGEGLQLPGGCTENQRLPKMSSCSCVYLPAVLTRICL